MQRTCDCCGTTQGPFVADRDMPGLRACGIRPRSAGKKIANPNAKPGDQVTVEQVRIRECIARRDALDAKRYGGAE